MTSNGIIGVGTAGSDASTATVPAIDDVPRTLPDSGLGASFVQGCTALTVHASTRKILRATRSTSCGVIFAIRLG